MSQATKYLSAFAGGLVFVAAGFGGYAARGMVDVGRWPLFAQREPQSVSIPSDRRPLGTDPAYHENMEADYFYSVADLIQQQYVEPVTVSEKMAQGAIKGMVAILSDPNSRFFDKETYPALLDRQSGKIHGVGIELSLDFDQDSLSKVQEKKAVDPLMLLPVLRVTAVYPGSAAESAGMKPGDEIRKLNGKNLLTYVDIKGLRQLQEDVTAKKADPAALASLQKKLQEMARETMSAIRARDVLYRGSANANALEWIHDGRTLEAKVESRALQLAPLTKTEAGFSLRFVAGAADALKAANPGEGTVIDLRNSGFGTFAELKKVLLMVCPKGKIGDIASGRGPSPITQTGDPAIKANHWVVLVDSTTRGAAAVFARTLEAQHLAKLNGTPSADDDWVETIDIDGQTGYTLVTGHFKPQEAAR